MVDDTEMNQERVARERERERERDRQTDRKLMNSGWLITRALFACSG